MGRYPLTPFERERLDGVLKKMSTATKTKAVLDYDSFCSWIRGEDPYFYNAIKAKLREVWEEFKTTVGEIAEGIAEGVIIAAATPVVIAVEGIKALGRWLDDL